MQAVLDDIFADVGLCHEQEANSRLQILQWLEPSKLRTLSRRAIPGHRLLRAVSLCCVELSCCNALGARLLQT